MPIEFNCPQCQKFLRVPDGSAGKHAKCPECGSVVAIPAASAPAEEPAADDDHFPELSAAPTASSSAGSGAANPYASPTASAAYEFGGTPDGGDQRTGPPWESEGQSFDSFFKTFKLVIGQPAEMFSTMRRTENFGPPMTYGAIGATIGAVIGQIFQVLLQGAIGGGEALVGGLIGMACALVLIPVFVIIGMFISSGITHLMLMMLGGAKFGFHTTFRVIAYTNGTTGLLAAIPILGGIVGGIMQIVYSIIGLSKAHEISGGKAAAAVLLPVVICCGLVTLVVVIFIGAAGVAGADGGFRGM